MADESVPDDNASDDESEVDSLLLAVARPPSVGSGLVAKVAAASTLEIPNQALVEAAEAAQGSGHEPAPGDVLDGHYRLLRELGRGGMGVVYAAVNLRTGKHVAVKWMSAYHPIQSGRARALAERFRREARAAAKIDHPNTVQIYDVGGTDQAPFLVMELLEGETLRQRLQRAALSWEEALPLMAAVMAGIEAAHRAGIVHRDLKPDNIFLCRTSELGPPAPKVLDFGVAAMREPSADGFGSLTRSGAILGTPAYMPLEQLTGAEVDARADVYALGVVLFEMLTRKLPFSARSASELAVLQATGIPARPSTYNPALTGAREAVLLRALARKPEDRFESVAAFAEALKRAAKPKPSRWWLWASLTVLTLGALVWWMGAHSGPEPHAKQSAGAERRVPPPSLQGSAPATALPPPAAPASSTEPTSTTLPASSAAPSKRVKSPRPPPVPQSPSRKPTDIRVDDF